MSDYGKLALKKIEEIYNELYSLKSSKPIKTSSISSSENGINGVQNFTKQLRFRCYSDASVNVSLHANVSSACNVEITLDGERVYFAKINAGGCIKEIGCSNLEAGVHTLSVSLTGDTFNLVSFNLTVNGNVYETDDDVFIEAFPSEDGFIKVELGKLEVYSFANSEYRLEYSIDGISKARVANSTNKIVGVVTQTGFAGVIDFTNGYNAPAFIAIPSEAKAVSVFINGYITEFLVATGNEIKHYLMENGILVYMGKIDLLADDFSVVKCNEKVLFFAQKGGVLTINSCMKNIEYFSRDRFTLTCGEV